MVQNSWHLKLRLIYNLKMTFHHFHLLKRCIKKFFKFCVWPILILTFLHIRETTSYSVIQTHKNGGHSFQLLQVRNHSSIYYLTHDVYKVRMQILVVTWNNLSSSCSFKRQICFCQCFSKMSKCVWYHGPKLNWQYVDVFEEGYQ